ncbi:MAG: acyltransferase [Nibricoccus sp.]
MSTSQPHLFSTAAMSVATHDKPARVKERNDTIDLLRIISACAVIWFHLGVLPQRRVAYAGLVFFLIIFVFFQKGSTQGLNPKAFFQKRVSRLLMPWAAWFVIYAVLNIVTGKRLFPLTSGFIDNILAGPWIGLWYLPFSFASACVTYVLSKPHDKLPPYTRVAVPVIVAHLTLFAAAFIRTSGFYEAPWAQWLQAAPSLPIGLAMASAVTLGAQSNRVLIAIEATIIITCAYLHHIDPGMGISYGVGSALVVVGLLFKRQLSPQIGPISTLCLGVYLIHGVVMAAFKLIPWIHQHDLVWFALTTVVSFLAVAVIQKIPYLQKFV